MRTEQINFRIDAAIKQDAEAVFKRLGLSSSDAMRMFYSQVAMQQDLPFDAKVKMQEPKRRTPVEQAAFEKMVDDFIRENKTTLDLLADR